MSYLLFRGHLVRKTLSGDKLATRRPKKKDQPAHKIDDIVWVRETWRVGAWDESTQCICVDYRADNFCRKEWLHCSSRATFDRLVDQSIEDAKKAGVEETSQGYRWKKGDSPCRWRPSIHMPRWASRIDLKITGVKADRLLYMTDREALLEGVPADDEFPSEDIPCPKCHGEGVQPNLGAGEIICELCDTPKKRFMLIWESIYGVINLYTWVWKYEYKVEKK